MTQGLPITYMDGNQQVGIRLKVMRAPNHESSTGPPSDGP
jgi:hypothetical protein